MRSFLLWTMIPAMVVAEILTQYIGFFPAYIAMILCVFVGWIVKERFFDYR